MGHLLLVVFSSGRLALQLQAYQVSIPIYLCESLSYARDKSLCNDHMSMKAGGTQNKITKCSVCRIDSL